MLDVPVNAFEFPLFLARYLLAMSQGRECARSAHLGVFVLPGIQLSTLAIGQRTRLHPERTRVIRTMKRRCSQKWARPGMSS